MLKRNKELLELVKKQKEEEKNKKVTAIAVAQPLTQTQNSNLVGGASINNASMMENSRLRRSEAPKTSLLDFLSSKKNTSNWYDSMLEKKNKATNSEGYTNTGKTYGDYYYQNYSEYKNTPIYKKDNKYYMYLDNKYQPLGKIKKNSDNTITTYGYDGSNYLTEKQQTDLANGISVMTSANTKKDKLSKEDKKALLEAKKQGYKEPEGTKTKDYQKAESKFKRLQKEYNLTDEQLQEYIDTGKLSYKNLKKNLVTKSMINAKNDAEYYRKQLENGKIKKYEKNSNELTAEQRLDVETAWMNNENLSNKEKKQRLQKSVNQNIKNNKISQEATYQVGQGYLNRPLKENQSPLEKILYGTADVSANLVHGIGDFVEDVGDTLTYGVADVASKLGAKKFAKVAREQAQEEDTNTVFEPFEAKVNKGSILGQKSKSAVQSIGHTLPIMAAGSSVNGLTGSAKAAVGATSAMTFTSSFGDAKTRALNSGASNKEATQYAFVQATAETISEQIFDGIPGAKSAGWADNLVGRMGNSVTNYLGTRAGKIFEKTLNVSGEGFEEIISNVLSAVGNDIVHSIDKNYKYGMEGQSGNIFEDILGAASSQESKDAFVSALLTSAILNGSQAVISNQTKNTILDAYAKDNNITREEAKQILTDENGNINYEKIKEQINNQQENEIDTPQEVKQEVQQEIKEEVQEQPTIPVEKMNEILNDVVKKSDVEFTQEEISELRESMYKQVEKLGAKVEESASFIKSAEQHNFNSNSEEIKSVARMMEARNIKSSFDSTPFINNSEAALWSIDNNGKRSVVFNPNADEKTIFQNVAVHELTHDLLSNKSSAEVLDRQDILEYISKTPGYDIARKSLEETYSQRYDRNSNQFKELVDEEVIASVLGSKLGNQEFINRLNGQKPNLARRIYNWVVDKIDNLGKSAEYKQEKKYWKEVADRFEKAFNMEHKNSTQKSDTRYSIHSTKSGLKYVIDNKLKQDSNMTLKEVFNSIKNTEYLFEDGDTAYIVGWLKSNSKSINNKSMYNELFSRYPSVFKNIDDIKDFNKLVNYNTDELLKTSVKTQKNIADINNKHKYWNIESFDTRESVLYDDANDKAYVIDFSIANLKDGKKIAYAKKMAKASNDILNKIKTSSRSLDSPIAGIANNISQSNKNVKSDISTKYSIQAEEKNTQKNEKGREQVSLSRAKQRFKNNIYKYGADGAFEDSILYYNLQKDEIKSLYEYAKNLDEYNKNKHQIDNVYNNYKGEATQELDNSSFSIEENNKLRDRAKNELGTTNDLREAGYLTNDGEYLDFSGKKQGARGGQRQMDHREISDIYTDSEYDAAEKKYSNMGSATAILQDFIDKGNIRLNGTGVEIATVPTQEQYDKLYDYLDYVQKDNGEVFIDLDTESKNRENLEYNGKTSINKMINDIKEHYKNTNTQTTVKDSEGRTLSKEQQEYFKDSKVRDNEGKLKVMYHGTPTGKFNIFDSNQKQRDIGFLGRGFYFTSDLEDADEYSKSFDTYDYTPNSEVKEVYLNIKKPYIIPTEVDYTSDMLAKRLGVRPEQIQRTLISQGYDGIIYDANWHNEYVVFNSNQIKNVDNTKPTANEDIRFSKENNKWDAFVNKNFSSKGKKTTFGELKNKNNNIPISKTFEKEELNKKIEIKENNIKQEKNTPKEKNTIEEKIEKEKVPNTIMVKGNELSKGAESLNDNQVAEILTEYKEQPKGSKRKIMAMLKAAVVDKGAVFEDLSIKNKNKELMAKWDYMLTSEARGQNTLVNGHYEYDPSTKQQKQTSKSLNSIQQEVINNGLTKELYEYMYHQLNIDRMTLEDRFENQTNKPVFGKSINANESRKIVHKLEQEHPELIDYAKDIYDYLKADKKKLVESGIIDEETSELWDKMYPHYVPISRVDKNGKKIKDVPLFMKREGINSPVKSATGGNSSIQPLFETIASRTLQTEKAISKNNFGLELKNTLKGKETKIETDVNDVINSIDTNNELLQKGTNGSSPTLTIFENGEKITFDITPDMYYALEPLGDKLINKTFKAPNKFMAFQRGVLTEYNPLFMITNSIKDAQDVLINSKHPAKTYSKFLEAYKQIIKKGYWYKEYTQNGGEHNSYFDNANKKFEQQNNNKIKSTLKLPLTAISKANNVIEMAPRLAEYIVSRENGQSIESSMLDAARVTTNFKAGGDVTKFMNRNGFTFLNASVQGAAQQIRNIREANMQGMKGYVKLATKFTIASLPALLLNGLIWKDDDDYEELSDYVKQNYYIVGKYGKNNFIRIPKGRMVAVIQDAITQVMNKSTGKDELDFQRFFKSVMDNIAPNNPLENNILSPITQAISNKTWYGEDLVPQRLKTSPKKEQYDESTDSFSKWLGEKINVSPYKINYILDQYSGGIGDVLLPMSTPKAESGDNSLLGKMLAPTKSKFTTDSTFNNQNVADYYKLKDKLTEKAKSQDATEKDKLRSKYINSKNYYINQLYAEKRTVQNSKLNDKKKYNQVKEIQQEIVDMTKEVKENYNKLTVSGDYATVGDLSYRKDKNGDWVKVRS